MSDLEVFLGKVTDTARVHVGLGQVIHELGHQRQLVDENALVRLVAQHLPITRRQHLIDSGELSTLTISRRQACECLPWPTKSILQYNVRLV